MKSHSVVGVLVAMLAVGCSQSEKPLATTEALKPKPAKVRVSSRQGNPNGSVLIVEYHKVAVEEARWDRSIARFKADLERYYAMGFRPVTLSAYLHNTMDLAPGASPIVFTFDDSQPSQFRLKDDGTLDPSCALGIWEAFTRMHPDFPIKATFFVLPNSGPWGQPKLARRKFKMLKEWGCEVGSHTLTHPQLTSLSDAKVVAELVGSKRYVEAQGFTCEAIALPFGIFPKRKDLIKDVYRAALLVGAGPAPAPTSPKFDPMRLPRIQSIEGDFGITYWLDRVEQGKVKVFVQP